MPHTLTEIERKILDYMVQYLRSNTYQPSIREIGERFGIKSTKTVSEHLQALADKGFLERDPSRSRGVRILDVDLSGDTVSVPCYRDMPATRSALRERADLYLSIDRRLGGGAKGSFFVLARGEQLELLGVRDGDYVLIEPVSAEAVADGDVVVVQMGERVDFQRVSRNGRGLTLQVLKAGGEITLVEDPFALAILGKVSALFRRLEGEAATVSLTAH
jgi:repressor LexA